MHLLTCTWSWPAVPALPFLAGSLSLPWTPQLSCCSHSCSRDTHMNFYCGQTHRFPEASPSAATEQFWLEFQEGGKNVFLTCHIVNLGLGFSAVVEAVINWKWLLLSATISVSTCLWGTGLCLSNLFAYSCCRFDTWMCAVFVSWKHF